MAAAQMAGASKTSQLDRKLREVRRVRTRRIPSPPKTQPQPHPCPRPAAACPPGAPVLTRPALSCGVMCLPSASVLRYFLSLAGPQSPPRPPRCLSLGVRWQPHHRRGRRPDPHGPLQLRPRDAAQARCAPLGSQQAPAITGARHHPSEPTAGPTRGNSPRTGTRRPNPSLVAHPAPVPPALPSQAIPRR